MKPRNLPISQTGGGTCTEVKDMEENHVCEICTHAAAPEDYKLIGARWVSTQKDNGRYRARCFTKGYSQIPGKDLMVADTTLYLLLVIKRIMK